MTRGRKFVLAGVAIVAMGAGGAGLAQAGAGDSEEQVSGPAADRAERAALDAVGGGRVVGVERDDDGNSGWEVEVERGGGTVEVHLSPGLEQRGTERDDDGAGDSGEGEDGD